MSLADYKKAKAKLEGHQIETNESTKYGESVVVRFKEDKEGFYFGGKTTVDMYKDFIAHNVDWTKEEVKVKYSMKESQNGNEYVDVEVL